MEMGHTATFGGTSERRLSCGNDTVKRKSDSAIVVDLINDENPRRKETLRKEAVVLGTSVSPISIPAVSPPPPPAFTLGERTRATTSGSGSKASTLTIPIANAASGRPRVASGVGVTPMAMTATASGAFSTRNRRLSFEVPQTPESAYVGGISAQYDFGLGLMSSPRKMPMQAMPPSISEYAPSLLTGATAPASVSTAPTLAKTTTMPSAGPGATMLSNMTPNANAFMPGMYSYQSIPVPSANGGYTYMPMQMGMPPMYGQQQAAVPTTYTAPQPATSVATDGGMRLDLGSLIPTSGAPGQITTIMLRNIPLKYNREGLIAELDARGFANTYDFFYLPIDFHTGNNVGYAFINFLNEPTVKRFREAFNGMQLSADSAKVCEVSDAKAQGKMKNVEQYRNSSVMSMEDRYQPIVLENGVRQPFPPPTRSLKPVKPRARVA